jgi:hypothetical protein
MEGLSNNKNPGCSIDSAILHLKEIILDEESYDKAKNGVSIICPANCLSLPLSTRDERVTENSSINQYIRLKSPQHVLFGIGKIENNRIKIERLLN